MADLQAILDRTGDPATVAWAHEGQGDLAALPDPQGAITAAERLGNAAALQAVTGPKDLRKAAAIALHRLKSRGVKVQAPAPRAGVLGSEVVVPEGHAWLSFPDEEGSVTLLVGYTGAGGTRILDMELTRPGEAWARTGPTSKNAVRDTGADLVREGAVELPFLVGLRYAHEWREGADEADKFLAQLPPELLDASLAVDPAAHLPPPGEDVGGTGWVYPADAFVGDSLDAASNRLAVRLADINMGEQGRLPPEVEAAFEEAGNLLLDHLGADERRNLADVARFGALVRRWHGAVGAAERLEAQAEALLGDTPARDIPGMSLAARRAVLIEAMRAVSADEAPEHEEEA